MKFFIYLLVALIAGGFGVFLWKEVEIMDKTSISQRKSDNQKVDIGGKFALINHKKELVTSDDFKGQFTMVFFGYANCPGVCPVAASIMSLTMDEIGSLHKDIQPIFISIDPERDTPEYLDNFSKNYNSKMQFLTGSRAETEALMDKYKIYAKKTFAAEQGEKAAEEYDFDHSSLIYLFDRVGGYLTHFPYDEKPEILAQKIIKYMGNARR